MVKKSTSSRRMHSRSDQNRPLTRVNWDGPWLIRAPEPLGSPGPRPLSTAPALGGQPLRRGSLHCGDSNLRLAEPHEDAPGTGAPHTAGPQQTAAVRMRTCRRPPAAPARSHFRLLPWFTSLPGAGLVDQREERCLMETFLCFPVKKLQVIFRF